MKNTGIKIIATNKKASFNYFLSDFLEVGIALVGTEIKSLRVNGASMNDAYVVFKNGEAFLINMHISIYKEGNIFNHDPLRSRKLLLHKKEILKLSQKVKEKQYTVVPTKIYFKDGCIFSVFRCIYKIFIYSFRINFKPSYYTIVLNIIFSVYYK